MSDIQQQPPQRETYQQDGQVGHVFVIPEGNLPGFQAAIDKLAKRAKRIDGIAPMWVKVREEDRVQFRTIHGDRSLVTLEQFKAFPDWKKQEVSSHHVIVFHHIALFHPVVQVNGWEFLAKLEHTEEGNILHVLEGKIIPPQYRNSKPDCDHCNVKRRRLDTFVLYSEAESRFIQVGRNCLADFLGRDAERDAAMAELYYIASQIASSAEEDDERGSGGNGSFRYIMLENFLSYVAEVIIHIGWFSRKMANINGGSSTSDTALRHLFRTGSEIDQRDFLFQSPSPKAHEQALAAIAWAESLTDLEVDPSDYLHNIRVIARRGVVGDKQFGYAASIVSSHLKHLGELEERKRASLKPSEWQGEIGMRRYFAELTVERVFATESQFGVTNIHTLSDKEGNKFVWYRHGGALDIGRHMTVKATVKDHNEYKGVKQTIINRVEEVELKTYLFTHRVSGVAPATYTVLAVDDKDASKQMREMLQVKRLPKTLEMSCPSPSTTTIPPVVAAVPTPPPSDNSLGYDRDERGF